MHPFAWRLTLPLGAYKTSDMDSSALDQLKYDERGLVPIIVQDDANGQVLVLAWTNREALTRTIETGKVHTYSRSRGRIAMKGESSGHFQLVKSIYTDCDRDAIVIRVEQIQAACHEGYRSCFYRQYDPATQTWKTVAERVFDPKAVYHA